MDASPQHRWFSPAPAWLVYASLLLTALLNLAERWRWFSWNEHKGWTVLVAVAGLALLFIALGLWFVVAVLFRRRFQFSLRTLLVLVVAVALPCNWLAVEMRKADRQEKARVAIKKCGGRVFFEYEMRLSGLQYADNPSVPRWLWRLLGDAFFDDFYAVMVRDSQTADAAAEQLAP